jgi:hypothetical protein
MTRLCTRISQRSQVLVPSPQGDLRTVRRSTLVGMRTGPRTLRPFSSRAPLMRSAQTCQHPHFSLSSPSNHFCPFVFLSFPFTAPSSFPISPFPAPPCLPHVCSPSHLPLLTRGEALGGRVLLLMDADCALAQSARLPTSQPMGHHRLLVQCRAVAARARPDLHCTKQVPQRPPGTCIPTLRLHLPKALTFSRLATDLEVVRVMRILDSAPVASPSTCTPRRVSRRRARRTCVRKRGPFRGVQAAREPRAARH